MEHENRTNLCPSFGYLRKTNRRLKTISKELQGKHQHWLIWWPGKHPFSASALYKFISKYSIEWDRRLTPETYCNCGPLFINYKILNYKFTTTIFCNSNGRKILDWSHLNPDLQPTEPLVEKRWILLGWPKWVIHEQKLKSLHNNTKHANKCAIHAIIS